MRMQEVFILGVTVFMWVVTLCRQGFAGLMYFYFFTGLNLMNVFAQFRWLRIPFFTAIFAGLALLFTPKERKVFFFPESILMIVFFGVMCLSRLINGLEVMGGEYMDGFMKTIIAFILIVNLVDSRERVKWMIWVLVLTAADLALVARYHGMHVPYIWMNRNNFGVHLVAMLSFPFLLFLHEKRILLKTEALGYFLVIAYSIVGTNSRGAYLGAAAVVLFSLIRHFKMGPLIILVPIVAIGLTRVSDVYWERMSTISTDTEQGGTAGQRLALWGTALRMIEANPLWGVGIGEFPFQFDNYATLRQKARVGGQLENEIIKVHNSFLQVASESGLVGFSFFMAILAYGFRNIFVTLRLCRGDPAHRDYSVYAWGVGVSLTGYLVAGFFGNDAYHILLYTLIALTRAMRFVAADFTHSPVQSIELETMVEKILRQYPTLIRLGILGLFTYITLGL